jgi:Holliday junction DNA helicase RuvA
MIACIRGRVIAASPSCVVDVGGVGFELLIPEKDRERLSPADGEVTFHTYLYVREDRLSLFGFLDSLDRELFLRLIDVSGVGPKLALGVLSSHPSYRIVSAIQRRESSFLTTLPGLGKKTAERLCMELSEKLGDLGAPVPVSAGASTGSSGGVREEVLLALTSLGLTRAGAELTLERMKWSPEEGTSVEEAVREALRYAANK